MKRIAVCPGSFDPVTVGHLDIITRASKLFDQVIVLVSKNIMKNNACFSPQERKDMILCVTKNLPNVTVDISAIVKGLRAVSDFEYEFQMALANRKLYAGAETVFLTTTSENMYLSSSVVKQIAAFGGDISHFVPPEILDTIVKRLVKERLS